MLANNFPIIPDVSLSELVHDRPGFEPARLVALARERIAETGLDLNGRTVLTEAATGVYVVTPILAALAGARRVYALARDSRHGRKSAAVAWLHRVAEIAGVADVISIVDSIPEAILEQVDLVTNSGHLRPIDARIVDALPSHAVIALMFEAWEWREADIDLAACRRRGIPVVGVNERHQTIDVFSYLGPLAVRLLQDAGVAVYRSTIALVCDNEFGPSLLAGLGAQGARIVQATSVKELAPQAFDAVLIALRPAEQGDRVVAEDARLLAAMSPQVVVAQFWGDVNRLALLECGLAIWPPNAPAKGHMGILLSAIGPEPVVRLQAGGLKAAEIALGDGEGDETSIAQLL
ncbi:hypothetical protein ACFQI3_14765 [Hansschlegelia quercus]|uniref:Uncharacterized protein n=1 Tax=Hansschlegelia quercus TaxID=2528245 RepID=A0A4Q9G957_9HYPH|nr:hypothetical protein [Hansschlegelia quercus]TBN47307.1 hypothetical protein EYR15_16330 [Hansschlegelia quercus]